MPDDNQSEDRDPLGVWAARTKKMRETPPDELGDGVSVHSDGSLVVNLQGWIEGLGRRMDRGRRDWRHEQATGLVPLDSSHEFVGDNWALLQDDEVIILGTEISKLREERSPRGRDKSYKANVDPRPQDFDWWLVEDPPLTGWPRFKHVIKSILYSGWLPLVPVYESHLKPLHERIAWRVEEFERNLGI